MSKFADLDAMIAARIARAPCSFAELQDQPIRRAYEGFAEPNRRGFIEGWRVLDRRLQALRKQGHIVYQKGQWHLTRIKGDAS